jgi:hypothetical protein
MTIWRFVKQLSSFASSHEHNTSSLHNFVALILIFTLFDWDVGSRHVALETDHNAVIQISSSA